MFRHKVDLVSAGLAKLKPERRNEMRELSINEVDEVSGGVGGACWRLVEGILVQLAYEQAQLVGDAISQTPTGPDLQGSGVGACPGSCHGG